MDATVSSIEGFHSSPVPRLEHPVDLAKYFGVPEVAAMMRRSLNVVDARLVDHGLRVGIVLDAMLEAANWPLDKRRREVFLVAALHDVGAYRTEEIDRLVEFETDDVWEHSFYGCLFFRELSPLAAYADVVLYHHMPDDCFTDQDLSIRFLAQVLHVADRVDVLMLQHANADADEIKRLLMNARPGMFSSEATELFFEAERRFGVVNKLRGPLDLDPRLIAIDKDYPAAATEFLDMLVHVIDFRSRHTVTHTVTTAWVAYELARRLLPEEDDAGRVYGAGILHDLGKIGIPLSILEKPGRLDADEMSTMRKHVLMTEDILAGYTPDDIMAAAVRHHEKLDGSGYPYGLQGDALALSDRIVAVADIVSALVGMRSYKLSYPKEKVLRLLNEQSAKGLLDRVVVETMTQDYDGIMEVVVRACRPVSELYQRVQEEYLWLLEELFRMGGTAQARSEKGILLLT